MKQETPFVDFKNTAISEIKMLKKNCSSLIQNVCSPGTVFTPLHHESTHGKPERVADVKVVDNISVIPVTSDAKFKGAEPVEEHTSDTFLTSLRIVRLWIGKPFKYTRLPKKYLCAYKHIFNLILHSVFEKYWRHATAIKFSQKTFGFKHS